MNKEILKTFILNLYDIFTSVVTALFVLIVLILPFIIYLLLIKANVFQFKPTVALLMLVLTGIWYFAVLETSSKDNL